MTMTPEAFASDYIKTWEDGGSSDPNYTHSLDRDDGGNYAGGKVGLGPLVGSNHGVTPQALAAHRNQPVSAITKDVMHNLSISEAVDIALDQFYHGNKLDKLAWNAVTASVMDFGWGAGPLRAVQRLQSRIGCNKSDGVVGPQTIAAYDAWLKLYGVETCARKWADSRNDYYHDVVVSNPTKLKYLKGWKNRTAYFLPGGDWWKRFNGNAK